MQSADETGTLIRQLRLHFIAESRYMAVQGFIKRIDDVFLITKTR